MAWRPELGSALASETVGLGATAQVQAAASAAAGAGGPAAADYAAGFAAVEVGRRHGESASEEEAPELRQGSSSGTLAQDIRGLWTPCRSDTGLCRYSNNIRTGNSNRR